MVSSLARCCKIDSRHAARDGQTFAWNTPPQGGHPGEDYGCRCWAEPVAGDTAEFAKQEVGDISDSGQKWSTLDFISHYYFGRGNSVSLSEVGHLKTVVYFYLYKIIRGGKNTHERVNQQIIEAAILAGLYDFAQVETFLLNYADISQGVLQLRTGWLGEVQLNQQHFVAEVRGLTQKLSQHMGELYSPVCRARLGDERCKVDVSGFSETGAVDSADSASQFSDAARTEPASTYDGGEIKFLTGANIDIVREVKFFFTGGVVQTALPFPFMIEQGDGYIITRGCDKTLATCSGRFGNAINFRGEPHVPGLDKVLQTAATRQE